MDGFKRFGKAVKDYQRIYLKLKEPKFDITEKPYDLVEDWKDPTSSYPMAKEKGVYAVFDEEENLLYVGKASAKSSIGKRLAKHFENYKKPGWNPEKFKKDWEGMPRYILAVSVEHPFEAPSLEEYLISELQPKSNSVGRN